MRSAGSPFSKSSATTTESPELSRNQLQILQHALGVDQYGRGPRYRNRFCAGADDEPTCRELVALGYMRQHVTTDWLPYFNCSVTDAGISAMLTASPKPPVLTRSQQRYREWLRIADAVQMEFGEWLKYEAAKRKRGVDYGVVA